MPYNGNGIFSRIYSFVNDAAAGIKIRADRMDNELSGIAQGLSTCVTKDGQTTPTANLPMATNRHTNVGNAQARNEYAALGQVQDGTVNWVAAGGTADVITATYNPTSAALVDGQVFYLRASAANATTTPTFNPNGIAASTITKNGGAALVAGDIAGAGHEIILRYRSSPARYELLNPSSAGALSKTGGSLTGALNEAKGADIASAATTDIGAATGNFVHITGTTAITAFGTVQAGTRRELEFDGVLTLTNSAALILPTGANIVTQVGDTATAISEGGGNWRVVAYRRANGRALSGNNKAYAETVAYVSSSAANIPLDDSIPQSGEGIAIVGIAPTFTPSSATARVRVRFQCQFSSDVANRVGIFAIFDGQGTNAVASVAILNPAGQGLTNCIIEKEYVPGVATALSFSVRFGRASADFTLSINGTTGRVLGGSEAATLVIEEV